MRGNLRRNQILECAIKVFSTKGYYESKVDDILRMAKAGRGTFYIYFKNKEDLFVALLARFLEEWEEQVLRQVPDMEESTVLDYFRDLVTKSFAFYKGNEDLCNIYLRIGPGLNPTFESFIVSFEDKLLDHISRDLKRAQAAGFVRPDLDIEAASNMIAGAFLRLNYYYFVLRKNTDMDTGRLAGQFLDFILKGIVQ